MQERRLDVFGGRGVRDGGKVKPCDGAGGEQRFQFAAAVLQRRFEERETVTPEQIVTGNGYRDFAAEEEVVAAGAAEAFLQLGEGQGATVAPGEQFAVDDEIAGQHAHGRDEIGKLLRDAVQVAGKQFHAFALFVDLAADAVVFFLQPDGRAEPGENRFGGGLGTREHELQRVKDTQGDDGELVGARGPRDGVQVAAEQVGFAHRIERASAGGGDGFLDETFFQTDAQIASDDFDEVFGGAWRKAAEAFAEQVEFRGGTPGGGQLFKKRGDVRQRSGPGLGATGENRFRRVAAVAETDIGATVVALVETGEFEEGALDDGPAEIERARIGLRERASGKIQGGKRGFGVVETREVFGEEADFFEFAGGGFNAFGDGREGGEIVGVFGHRGRRGRFYDHGGGRRGHREFELVVASDGPGLDTAFTQRAGKVFGETVQGEHAARIHELDEAEEVVEIGVIGKRERGVALVAKARAGIQRPTGDHRGAGLGDGFEKRRAGRVGWCDDHVARRIGGGEFAVRGKCQSAVFVNASEARGLFVQHHGQPGAGEAAEDFLAFAETVAEEHRGFAVVERFPTKPDDVPQHVGGGRQHVVGTSIRRLHDEHVGGGRGAGFGGETGAEFEISGVEQASVRGVFQKNLRGTVDVSGGMERDRVILCEGFGASKRQDVFAALGGHAGPHQLGRAFGADDLSVRGEVVEMRVRNEGTFDRVVRVEPPAGLRQPYSVAKLDIPSHASGQRSRRRLRDKRNAQVFASREYLPAPVNSRPRHTTAMVAG